MAESTHAELRTLTLGLLVAVLVVLPSFGLAGSERGQPGELVGRLVIPWPHESRRALQQR